MAFTPRTADTFIIWENAKINIVDICTMWYSKGKGGGKMADYKAMYLAAMDAMEQAVTLLIEAQRRCEGLYVTSCAREEELQNRQLREQKIDRYVRIAVAGAELVLPLMFYGIWMRRGFKFEESGVYSSTTFRNLFSRFRPTK